MAVKVIKMGGAFTPMPQSEAVRLRAQVAALKKTRRGLKLRLTHLQNRSGDLLDYLDDYVLPKLKTVRKKKCEEGMENVRRLL